MKRKIHFLLVILFITNIAFSQEYFPLVKENAVWNITNVNFAQNPWESDSYNTVSYRIFGDTTINTVAYKKLWTVNCFDQAFIEENSTYFGAIREENKKVYFFKDDVEYTIYDFSLEVGNAFSYYSFFNNQFIELQVESIETAIINGENRNKINLLITDDFAGEVKSWIEGIGSEAGLIDYVFPHGNFDVYLNCYKENEELIYSYGSDCCIGLTSTIPSINEKCFEVYPNPSTEMLNITGGTITKIQIINLNGNIVLNQNSQNGNISINIHNLPQGIYFIKIFHDENISIKKFLKI